MWQVFQQKREKEGKQEERKEGGREKKEGEKERSKKGKKEEREEGKEGKKECKCVFHAEKNVVCPLPKKTTNLQKM